MSLKRLNIGCITRHNFPTDQEIRITKFSIALEKIRHNFYVFCPGSDNQKTSEKFARYHVDRLIPSNFLIGVARVILAPLPINPIWIYWFFKKFKERSLAIVIVRDLRLAFPAYLASRLCGVKMILDLGEHYPGMVEIVGKQKFIHHLIRNKLLITILEILSVKLADHIWVVVDENKKRLSKFNKNISVISNYPVLDDLVEPPTSVQANYTNDGEPIKIISLGIIDNIRGLDKAIQAFSMVYKDIKNIRLVIYGDGSFKKTLVDLVDKLGLEGSVIFGGWVPEHQKYKILSTGHVGLTLHKVCDLTQHTIPNKLFDYMLVGLPVISTKLQPIERILEAENCGISVVENPDEIAIAMKEIILDINKRKRFSNNAVLAMKLRYRWDGEIYEMEKTFKKLSFEEL